MFGGISDGSQIFSNSEAKKLSRLVQRNQRIFPQSRIHFVTRSFPQGVNRSTILFWVFNRAGLSQESAKQGQNRDLVFLIEPIRKQAVIMVKFGLEPFVPQQALDQVIERAQPYFSSRDFAEGIEVPTENVSELLKSISRDLNSTIGLSTVYANEAGANDY